MEISILSRKILRDLCTDSRISISDVAKKYNITWHVARERIRALEEEFGLRYTVEVNYNELGLKDLHVIRAKFVRRPKPKDLEKLFKSSRVAQFVAITKGDFDMIIFALAKDGTEYVVWEMAIEQALAKYGLYAMSSEVNVMHLGFTQITNDTIETSGIDSVYKKMLEIVNENSRISIKDIGKAMGMSEALTRYYFRHLQKTKIVKRYTAIVTKSPLKVNIAFFGNYTMRTGIENRIVRERQNYFWKQPDEFPLVNEVPLMWSMSGSDKTFTIANYSNEKEGLRYSVEAHKENFRIDNPDIKQAVVEKVIKGYIPTRNVDQKAVYTTAPWGPVLF